MSKEVSRPEHNQHCSSSAAFMSRCFVTVLENRLKQFVLGDSLGRTYNPMSIMQACPWCNQHGVSVGTVGALLFASSVGKMMRKPRSAHQMPFRTSSVSISGAWKGFKLLYTACQTFTATDMPMPRHHQPCIWQPLLH